MKTLMLSVVALLPVVRASAAPDPRFDSRDGLSPMAGAPAAVAAPGSARSDDRLWIVFEAKDSRTRSAIVNAGISIEEVRPAQAAGIATPRALERARAAGLHVLLSLPLSRHFGTLEFPDQDKIYHNYARTEAELRRLAAKAPDIASLFSIGKTLQGRDIWALRLCPDAKDDAPSRLPGALFVGEHHAREHLSNEVPLALAGRLIDGRGDPDVARLLASRDVTIIPLLNADGAEYDIDGNRYHMHRKNMRVNADSSLGVDLNRNYGYHWGEGGASPDPADETYRGPNAFSEPETQAVKSYIESHSNIHVLLTYHTFSELVLYPWGYTDSPMDDSKAHAAYQAMAAAMGTMTGYTPEQTSQLYIASGDLTDWAWGARGIYSFTFEMMPKSMWEGGFYPGPDAIAVSVQLNWQPMRYLIGLADDPARVLNRPAVETRTMTIEK